MWEQISNITWESFADFVVDQVKNNEFFATAGFFGILTVIWQYTKAYPEYLWDRFLRRVTYTYNVYETDEFFKYLEQWLRDHREVSYRNVEAFLYYTKNTGPEVRIKQFEDVFFLWRRMRYIRVFKGRERLENASDLKNAYLNHFRVSGIFAKRAINSWMEEVVEYNLELKRKKTDSINIHTNDAHYWTRHVDLVPKPVESIIVEGKEDLLRDMQNFEESRDWYLERSIPYKRGYMFYGPPGNGKTTFCLSLAKHLNRDIYMFTPNSQVDDSDLQSLFRNLTNRSILVMEDVDALFGGRDKENDNITFSFSTLLNCLDGALSKQDLIVVFTTNHPENLDPALIREGRIDYKMEFGNPTVDNIIEYLITFFGNTSSTSMSVSKLSALEENNNLSMVQIQNICLRNRFSPTDAGNEIVQKLTSD